ncbi:MAG: acyl-CoA desaturase [Legionellales bacterium]|nr:acyl-CoA desaturase [Legionellales bacterium]|tara:strand:- start:38952 stop:40148 length:1197 start_codon:yes stop_codon:yes gene_type:complete
MYALKPYLFGLLDLPWWGNIIALLILTHITIIAVTVYLHRCQAHRGLDIHPALAHVFRLWLWLTTGMVTKEWVAIHRKHHAFCETEDDPHSPQIMGLKKILWQGAEVYREAAKDEAMVERYSVGTPNDWLERKVYTPFSGKGILLMLLIDVLLFGLPGITIWALQMIWIPFFAAGVINGIGHYFGYRNFECPDAATNIFPIGIITGGEELHNNHHTYGTSAKFSVKWWEFDLGWQYIKLFRLMGLAKVKKIAPQEKLDTSKHHIDVDTLKALLNNRFQVMAAYAKTVVKPVFKQEKRNAESTQKPLFKRMRKLLTREQSLITDDCQARIEQLLETDTDISVIYQYQQKLLAIWQRTTASQKELIEAFQEWCKQAEASGIDALSNFANYIRSYALRRQQ